MVAAPSKIIRPTGERVKTDARDALLLRMDELTAVRTDLLFARHRLGKLLLRHGIVYDGTTWTLAHEAWLRRIRKNGLADAGPDTLAAFDAAFDAVTLTKARRDRLDAVIAAMAAESPFT